MDDMRNANAQCLARSFGMDEATLRIGSVDSENRQRRAMRSGSQTDIRCCDLIGFSLVEAGQSQGKACCAGWRDVFVETCLRRLASAMTHMHSTGIHPPPARRGDTMQHTAGQ